MTRLTLALVTLVLLTGCGGGRKYVVKPDDAVPLNQSDWTIRSAPRSAEPSRAE